VHAPLLTRARHRLLPALLALLAAATAAADDGSTGAASVVLPSPGQVDAAAATVTEALVPSWLRVDKLPFIPVPEVATAPHAGVNLGLFPIMLSNDANGDINQILAPDIVHSQYFGWGARWRTFRYPSDDERWSVVGGAKQSVEREFDAEYDIGLRRDRAWSWTLHAMYDRSGTGRFYGYGNDAPVRDQTTYIDSQMLLEVTAAHNFSQDLQLAYLLRAHTAEIEQSALDSLPPIQLLYPNIVGIGDATEVQQRLVLSYDTRDSVMVPRRGLRAAVFAGFATRALGGSVDYNYFGVDASVYRPVLPNLTVVVHTALRLMPSYTNAPFWAYSSLGGDRSVVAEAQPLRGYGAGRFVDRNSFAASVEARTWVRSVHMFKTDLRLELAPFVDTGKVFSSMSTAPFAHLHPVGGMGFRVVTGPFVVGYLDVGIGREKLAFFSGIDYPF